MEWLGGVADDPVAVVRGWLDDWDTYPTGKFVVERRDGAFVGRVGLNYLDPRSWERSTAPDAQPELGWVVAREQWGCGYATEAACAVRAWAALPRLVSVIAPPNARSIRVAEKLGERLAGEVELLGAKVLVYETRGRAELA